MSTHGASRTVTVFGGTGFLGSRAVKALLEAGYQVRVTARNPERIPHPGAVSVVADIRDDLAVARAVEGAWAVVNAVSLYQQKGGVSFKAIHVDGAARLAGLAAKAGVTRLLHVSGLGVRDDSESAFVRARAQGEREVQQAFPDATILRPSVMIDCNSGFLKVLSDLVRFPVVPLFGEGATRLQPVWARDVAKAMRVSLEGEPFRGSTLELGGGVIYSYREAVELVASALRRQPKLIPVPFSLWKPLVRTMQHLPRPPITMDQLFLMQNDNVVSEADGFAALGIEPRSMEQVMMNCLAAGAGNQGSADPF